MNNYWETNYRAGQEGVHHFRFAIRPRAEFDEARAERFAVGIGQPLIAIPVKSEAPPLEPPIAIDADRAVVTMLKRAEDGEGLLVRLYNPGSEPDSVSFHWPNGRPAVALRSDVWERSLEPLGDVLRLGAYEIATLRFSQPDP